MSGRPRIILVAAATATLLAGTAQAGCISVGQLWSCVDVNGEILQMSCIGTGQVRTCQEFSGRWIEFGRAKVLSQVLTDADLSTSAARAGARHAAEADVPKEAGNLSALAGIFRATPNGVATVPPAQAGAREAAVSVFRLPAQQPRQHEAPQDINPPSAGSTLLPPLVSQRKVPPR